MLCLPSLWSQSLFSCCRTSGYMENTPPTPQQKYVFQGLGSSPKVCREANVKLRCVFVASPVGHFKDCLGDWASTMQLLPKTRKKAVEIQWIGKGKKAVLSAQSRSPNTPLLIEPSVWLLICDSLPSLEGKVCYTPGPELMNRAINQAIYKTSN